MSKELLKPKIDVVFHSLFRKGNEKITKALISSITNEKIKDIKLDNDRHILGRYTEEKMGILDLKAILDNGTICNIEVQLSNKGDTEERFLYYWSRIYSSQLVKGNLYKDLNKVIGIIIIDYNFEKTKEIERISTKWKIKEASVGKELELTDMFELYIIEIPKVKRILEIDPNNKLAQWILFLDNPNDREVFKVMKENEEIKEAMDDLEELSKDEELRRIAELKEKGIRDEQNGLARALEKGQMDTVKKLMESGVLEKEQVVDILGIPMNKVPNINVQEKRRIAELKEKGIRDEQNGLARALEKGLQQGQMDTVKKLMEKGLLNKEQVLDIFGITIDEN